MPIPPISALKRHKTCRGCMRVRSLKNFKRDRRRKDNDKISWCKDCNDIRVGEFGSVNLTSDS